MRKIGFLTYSSGVNGLKRTLIIIFAVCDIYSALSVYNKNFLSRIWGEMHMAAASPHPRFSDHETYIPSLRTVFSAGEK